jgi:ABC-type antimicrobial peptide transport system permease subunit
VPLNDNCVVGAPVRTDISRTAVPVEYQCNSVGPDYFRTLGIAILRGRDFTGTDRKGSQPVVILSQNFAHTVFGDIDPVGHTITSELPNEKSKLVVGVAKDSKYFTLSEKQRLAVYEPYFASDEPVNLQFLIRTAGPPSAFVKPITNALAALDSTSAIETKPMSRALGLALLPSRVGAAMLGAMGLLGLLLAAIGLYGVLLYSVSGRTREIGVRVALGATRSDVLQLISGHSLRLVGSGMLAGLVLSFFAMQPLAQFLVPGMKALDSAAFLAVIGVLGAIAVPAIVAPALRALRVDPLTALRYE